MAFTLAATDSYPYVCGVYTCRCGRTSVRHGRLAAVLPPGWHERRGSEHEALHVCTACAQADRSRRESASPPTSPG